MGRNELAVLGVLLKRGPACNQEIADTLQWPVNCITGRTMELREKGLVEEAYREVYKSRRVIHWQVAPKAKIRLEQFRGQLWPTS